MTDPSKHSGGRRKAVGGARIKPPEQVRRRSAARFAWTRTTRGQVLIAVGVLALALVLRFAVGGSDDEKPGRAQTPVGPALTTYGADWKAADGSSYRLTVTPIAELVSSGSASGCVPAAGAGRSNLRFTVRIDNRGTTPAPVPALEFAATVKPSGAVSRTLSFAKGSRAIDLTPAGNARDCIGSARVSPEGQGKIGPKSAAIFTGLIGGVKTPIGPGLSLIVRYSQADAGSATGSSDAEVLVQYPDLHTLS